MNDNNSVYYCVDSKAMDDSSSLSNSNSELWCYLKKISDIVQSRTGRQQPSDGVSHMEVERLKQENQELRVHIGLLQRRIEELEAVSGNAADGENERLSDCPLLTQETVLSEPEQAHPNLSDVADAELTDSSPMKTPQKHHSVDVSVATDAGVRKRGLFEEHLRVSESKKIKVGSQESDLFDRSPNQTQVEDSQGSDFMYHSVGNNDLPHDNTVGMNRERGTRTHKLDLSRNPNMKRQWYPEDFIKNPDYEKYVTDRSVNITSLPEHIANHYRRQINYIRSVATEKFDNISGDGKVQTLEKRHENDRYMTPLQDIGRNYAIECIPPFYKYEINKSNLSQYLKLYPNILRTNKVRNWDLDDTNVHDVCSDFLLTQEVKSRNNESKERAHIKALGMLFQACFVVENGKQLGRYVFRDNKLNENVCKSEFTIDTEIFK